MSGCIPLRQSTATTMVLGPALDKTDAITEETGLAGTLAVELWKHGGSSVAARNSATAITHLGDGDYLVPLDSTDTNTLGKLRVRAYDPSTYLHMWEWCVVLPANVYDSLYGSDKLDVSVVQVTGTAVSDIDDFKADVTGMSTFDASTDAVTVGGLNGDGAAAFYTQAATGSPSAATDSVVEGCQGTATEATVQDALTAQGYTTARAPKLDYLDAAISGISGGALGPGGTLKTIQVLIDGVAEDNVKVWITTDSAGANIYAGWLATDSDGEVSFMVEVGSTYYVWGEKGGKNITNNGAAWTVS